VQKKNKPELRFVTSHDPLFEEAVLANEKVFRHVAVVQEIITLFPARRVRVMMG